MANALLDFSPLNRSIQNFNRGHDLNQQRIRNDQEQIKTEARQNQKIEDDRFAKIKRKVGLLSFDVARMPEGPERAAAWQSVIKRMGDQSGMSSEDLDPMLGPKFAIAESGLSSEFLRADREDRRFKFDQMKFAQQHDLQRAKLAQEGRGSGNLSKGFERGPDGVARPIPGGKFDPAANAQRQAVVDLPKVENNSNRIIGQIDTLLADPNLSKATGPIDGNLPSVLGSTRATDARIAQLGGAAFLQAFQSLKGGGTITEIEGQKATAAFARITDPSISDEEFVQSLNDFKSEVQNLANLARTRAGQGGQQSAQSSPEAPVLGNVPTATQRQVGQVYETPRGSMVWRGNGWEPVQ